MTIKELRERLNKLPEIYDDTELNVGIDDSDIINELLCLILGEEFVNNADEESEEGEKVNKMFANICNLLVTPLKELQYRENLFSGKDGKMLLVGDSW